MIPDWLMGAALSGVITGLITYGGIRVEMRWHRTDIDRAHKRLDIIEAAIFRPRRAGPDFPPGTEVDQTNL